MPITLPRNPIRTASGGLAINNIVAQVRGSGSSIATPVASALDQINGSIASIEQSLRTGQTETLEQLFVVSADGTMVGWIGSQAGYQGGWLQQLYVGGTDPSNAPFFCDVNGNVFIGQNGSISILDPGANTVGWLGEQTDVQKTVLTATNATPVVIGITTHGYVNGDTVFISGCTGNTAANGYRIVKNKTASTFEITTLAGADVVGNGAYTGSGKCSRYFGGGWFQTEAIGGTGFSNAKLRAFANGNLDITDALITLHGSAATITLDPVVGTITVDGGAGVVDTWSAGQIELLSTDNATTLTAGKAVLAQSGLAANGAVADIYGYSTSGYGPSILFHQGKGTFGTPAATDSTNPLGAISGYGTPATGTSYETARMAFMAAEAFTSTNQGTDIVFEATPTSSTTKSEVMRVHNGRIGVLTASPGYPLDVNGDINSTGYRSGGTAGITGSQAFGVSLSLTMVDVVETISASLSSAITSVNFGAQTTTSGSFVTGITGNPISVVSDVTLTTKTLTWKTGLVTALA